MFRVESDIDFHLYAFLIRSILFTHYMLLKSVSLSSPWNCMQCMFDTFNIRLVQIYGILHN